MEIGLREWLIVGAIIVIVLIVVDGWRRMRAQSNSLKIDIDDKLSDLGDDCYNPELPLGTARVFVPKDNEDASAKSSDAVSAKQIPLNNTAHQNKLKPSVSSSSSNAPVAKVNPTATERINENLDFRSIPSSVIETATSSLLGNSVDNTFDSSADHSIEKTNDESELGFSANYDADELSTVRSHAATEKDEPLIEQDSAEQKSAEQKIVQQENAEQLPFETQDSSFSEDLSGGAKQTAESEENNVEQIASDGYGYDDESSEENIDLASSDSQKTTEATETIDALEAIDAIDSIKSADDQQLTTDFIESDLGFRANETVDSVEAESIDQQESLTVPDILKTDSASSSRLDSLNNQTVESADNQDLENVDVEEGSQQPIDEDLSLATRDMVPDKFEQLLAEREKDGFLPELAVSEESVASTLNAADSQNLATSQLDDDEAETTDLSSELSAKQDEIEALKARLRELSDENANKVQDSALESTTDSSSDSAVTEVTQLDELNTDDIEETEVEVELTTVIDDDVDLEELKLELASLEKVELSEETADDFDLQESISVTVENSKTANKLEETEIDVFDNTADPLMDNYKDSKASDSLVDQFEQDLEADSKSVANELDMPITEILKMNRQMSADQAAEIVEHSSENTEETDPLLEDKLDRDALLSVTNFSNLDDNDQAVESTADANSALEQEDQIDHADDLGFTALEQGYDEQDTNSELNASADPLMDGYDDVDADIDDTDNTDLSNQKTELSKQSQKSLFQESDDQDQQLDLESSLDFDQSTLKSQEKQSANDALGKISAKSRKSITNVDDPNAVLIVTVVAKDQYLNGAALKRVVQACGMEFGDMEVFHRFEDAEDEGAIQFSMANAINPGTFDFDSMDDTSTPGVSFFMSMDEPLDPKNALECMMATAETVANHLNGDLLDDDRTVIRPQTKEHYRERVRIHEMNKLSRRAL